MTDSEDLLKRYKLLEGENKLATEKLGGEIRANRELIKRMNEENKEMRQQVASLSHESSQHKNKQVSALLELKSRLNALSAENIQKESVVRELQAKISLTERHVTKGDNSEQARQIRVLENRIDKAMIKLNEAQSIKNTYESILNRLKEERIGFDTVLADLESQLKAKKKDFEDLKLLARDATHAKELAHAELHRFEQAVMEERNQRDREVMEKRLLVQKRVEMNRALEENRKSKITPSALPVLTSTVPNETDHGGSPAHDKIVTATSKHKHEYYEDAYKKLTEVAGCSDVNEIIQKFVNQEETKKDLERQVAQQESTVDALSREFSAANRQLEDLKFAGNGMLTNRKQALEDIEKHLNDSVNKLEQNRSRYERLARLMVDVHAGVNHLVTKLSEVKLDESETRSFEAVEVNDDTIEEVLNQCELKIQKLTQICAHIPEADDMQNPQKPSNADVRVRFNRNDISGIHLDDLEDDENFFALRKSHAALIPSSKIQRNKSTSLKLMKR